MHEQQRAAGLAIVTGAAGGIGSATARHLAAAGWPLLLCDLDANRLADVATPLRTTSGTVEILAGDIAHPGFTTQLLAALGDRPGGALVHAAGLSPRMAEPSRILQVNLDATVRLVDAVRPRMAENGAAVLLASLVAHISVSPEADAAFDAPLPGEGSMVLLQFAPSPEVAYSLSKRGVLSLVRREARAFGARRARIVSISPGMIDTNMTRGKYAISDGAKSMLERAPLPRLGQADEVASVAAFLCSPAASFVTGCDVRVDGGVLASLGH
jgi:NAD(P)-dependent dehydrogenase (short-subunit alcohol dehydrogenase family)